ncbi:MAG: zf-HC2 domain-containing protein [Acidobacteria bacterium]|nr:zf-HC2 domain-containing protein [Acidobacteriota bacterium]
MTCAQMREQLSAWVDGELPHDLTAAVDSHLASCVSCRTHARSMRALKHVIAQLPSREAPPGAVRARVEGLRFRSGRTRVARAVAWLASAVAAAALVWAAVQMRDRVPPSSHELAEELVADHLRSVPEVMPAEVTSQNPDDVRRFFAERVPFRPVAPVLPGARLLGGRLCRINGTRSQLLFYETHGQTLSLFISPAPLDTEGCEAARGNHICGRMVGRLALMLVGNLPSETLQQLLADAAL